MFKHLTVIRTTLYFLCFLSLIWGCDQQAEAPPQPKVITKKIVAKKKATVPQKLQKIDTAKPEIKKQAPQPIATVPAKQTLPPKAAAVVKQIPQPKTKIAAAATQTESEAKDKKLLASLAPTVQKLVLLDSADVYNPQGKLDPFEPLFKEERSAPVTRLKKKAKKPRHLTPLEQFSLSQLKLVGIIHAPSGKKAMVQEASGKGYVVTKGTYIGRKSGKIVEILMDRIIVEEEVEDIYGKVSVQKKPLIIQKPPGE